MKCNDFGNSLSVFLVVGLLIFLSSCGASRKVVTKTSQNYGSPIRSKVIIKKEVPVIIINTRKVSAGEVVSFAKKQIGTPYAYGSSIKTKGFDCSGFINYVFGHFNIPVPRISYQFTNAGKEVFIENSRRGDIILFTGSNANSGIVGHMGIITKNNNGQIQFIHASSSRGVMISGMNTYFLPRFVKVNRIFTVF